MRAQPVAASTALPRQHGAGSYHAALATALALVLLRGVAWVWFAPSNLDGDEAVIGLMGLHLAEGRAFPLFFYGQPYLLGVESWLAAPVFVILGAGARTLRGVILVLNLLVAWLLLRELVRATRLSPWLALAASLFVLVPTPRVAAMMGQAVGMNVEPFLAALLLWIVRGRPLLFGALFAVAFLNREFAAYALVALVVLHLLGRQKPRPTTAADASRNGDRRGASLPAPVTRQKIRAATLRHAIVASAGFAAVWDVVQMLRHYASPLGPGTFEMAGAEATNIGRVAGFAAFSPSTLPADLWAVATRFLPELFGARQEMPPALVVFHGWQAQSWAWPLLVLALGVPLAFVLARLGRSLVHPFPAAQPYPREQAASLGDPAVAFAAYLLLIGAQSALVYAVTRGPAMSVLTERYLLLALFGGVGLVSLVLVLERVRALRVLVAATAIAWGGMAAADNVRFLVACVAHPPGAPRLELAEWLESRGVKYGQANYWLAYPVSFLSGERVKLASTDVRRVEEYERLFSSHTAQAATVETAPCEGCQPAAGVWVRMPGR